jgi:putative transcriptional regulator
VLNRPSEIAVHDVLPAWGPHVSKPQAVFVGGPVEQKTALCLATLRTGEKPGGIEGVIGVRGPVALVDLDSDPERLAPRVRGIRVFAGYAGWDAEQLAGEIDRGDWFVFPALPVDILNPPGADLWGRVLRRQGMPMSLLATHPGDTRRN